MNFSQSNLRSELDAIATFLLDFFLIAQVSEWGYRHKKRKNFLPPLASRARKGEKESY